MSVFRQAMAGLILATLADPTLAFAPKRPVKQATPARATNAEILATMLVTNRYKTEINLASNCGGSSFKNLAIAMNLNEKTIVKEKTEFMTSEEFAKIQASVASFMEKNPLVICESVNDNEDIRFNYDADKQEFEAGFTPSHNVWRDVKQLGTYRSSTRMGVSAAVKASLELEYNVDLSTPARRPSCVTGTYSLKFNIPVPVSEAASLKRYGRIVFIATPRRPYIAVDNTEGEPTLDDPFDVATRKLTVSAKLEKIILMDVAGREVWSCQFDWAGE